MQNRLRHGSARPWLGSRRGGCSCRRIERRYERRGVQGRAAGRDGHGGITNQIPQRIVHFFRRLKTFRRVDGQCLVDKSVDVRAKLGRVRGRANRPLGTNLQIDVAHHGSGKREMPREDSIYNDAKRPQVGAMIDSLEAAHLFGAHVQGRSHGCAGFRAFDLVELHDLCNAKIEDFDEDFVVLVDKKDVGRFEVAMNDSLVVRSTQCFANLRENGNRFEEG